MNTQKLNAPEEYFDLFKQVGNHEAAATLYLALYLGARMDELQAALKDIRDTLDTKKAPCKAK